MIYETENYYYNPSDPEESEDLHNGNNFKECKQLISYSDLILVLSFIALPLIIAIRIYLLDQRENIWILILIPNYLSILASIILLILAIYFYLKKLIKNFTSPIGNALRLLPCILCSVLKIIIFIILLVCFILLGNFLDLVYNFNTNYLSRSLFLGIIFLSVFLLLYSILIRDWSYEVGFLALTILSTFILVNYYFPTVPDNRIKVLIPSCIYLALVIISICYLFIYHRRRYAYFNYAIGSSVILSCLLALIAIFSQKFLIFLIGDLILGLVVVLCKLGNVSFPNNHNDLFYGDLFVSKGDYKYDLLF